MPKTKTESQETTSPPEETTGAETQTTEITPTEPVAPQGKKGDDGGEPGKALSQEDVNKLLGKVRDEGRKTGEKTLLEAAGFDSAEQLNEAIKELQTLKRAKLTDDERLKVDLDAAQKKLQDAETKSQQAAEAARVATINAEIAKLAASRFASVDAVLRLVDRGEIKVTEDGSVEGVSQALDKVAENYPFALRQAGVSIVSPGNPKDTTGPKKRTDDQRRSQYFGMGKSDFWDGAGTRKIVETE